VKKRRPCKETHRHARGMKPRPTLKTPPARRNVYRMLKYGKGPILNQLQGTRGWFVDGKQTYQKDNFPGFGSDVVARDVRLMGSRL